MGTDLVRNRFPSDPYLCDTAAGRFESDRGLASCWRFSLKRFVLFYTYRNGRPGLSEMQDDKIQEPVSEADG